MIPLLLFSITAIGLIIERSRFWSRIIKRQPKVMQRVLMLYQENNVVEAIAVLKQNIDLPAARILLSALSLDRPAPEQFRLAMQAEAQAETPGMKRFTNVFDMIVSFASLNLGNVGGSQTAGVTGGISEALVSTASGLIVAIFNLFALLTFFIVSTLFLTRSEGLPVNLPRAETARTQQQTRIAVSVQPGGTIAPNKRPIQLSELGSKSTHIYL